MMTGMADSHAYSTHSSVPCKAACVAVVPMLVFKLLTRSQEGALLFRPGHVFSIIIGTVKPFLSEAF